MLKLAFKNINRNKRRTFLSGLTIFIATLAVISFLGLEEGMFNDIKNNAINHANGNINIKTKLYEEHERVMPLQFYVPQIESKIEIIEKIEGVESVHPLTRVPVSIWRGDDNNAALAYGINFDNKRFFGEKQTNIEEGTLPIDGSKEVAITKKLASFLDLSVGNTFTFLSRTASGGSNAISVKVSSIVTPNNSDLNTNAFFISNKTLSKMLRMDDGAIELFVYTNDKVAVESVEKALNDQTLIIQSWKDISIISFIVDFAVIFYGYIKILFFFLASTVIINTTMMSVIERRREAATLIALGYSEKWVRNLFLLESAMISFFASFLGAIIGGILINTVGQKGIDLMKLGGAAVQGFGFNNYVYFTLPISQYFSTIVYAIVIAVIACYFPTRKILKIQPAQALHDEI